MKYCFLRFPEGKYKAVTLSYDDGCIHDIKMVKQFNKYGLKCTFNLNSGYITDRNDGWHMSKEEITDNIINNGHEIAVHGEFHKAPGTLRAVEGIKDVLNCRLELERQFGGIIRGMAYPDGGITRFANNADYDNIRRYLKDLDIVYARSLGADNDKFELPTDWYNWVPTVHHSNKDVFEYIDKFVALRESDYIASNTPKLFYMWGHSFEFANNKWDLLEEICNRLSGKEDIWYATNMQIYNYVTAYNSLVFSADGNTVYNPTLYKIWLYVDSGVTCVESGETKKLA